MPYGVKRGFKSPGNFGLGDIMGLGLAGSAGIIAALVTDYQQQGEASALFTINRWVVQVGEILGFTDIPLWMVVVGMTVVGAGSIFYFQPITRQGAFAQGFGLLAVLMTATPADLAGGLESFNDINESLPGFSEPASTEASLYGGRLINASYTTGGAQIYQAQHDDDGDKYDLHLTINFPDGIPGNIESMIRRGTIRGRLHNEESDQTYNLFRSAGGELTRSGNSLMVHAGVPARFATSTLHIRIECIGYQIEEQSTKATMGETVEWVVDMKPTSTPLFFQRLGKSYWY